MLFAAGAASDGEQDLCGLFSLFCAFASISMSGLGWS